MELTRLRSFLLTLPGAQEDTPFGPEILVYRIAGDLWQGWVHHSYERVVAGLPKAKRPQAPQR